MLKRVVYLGYYLREMNWGQLQSFLNYTALKTKRSKANLLADALKSVFKYNISILEYFQFRFFEKNHDERYKWAGTGFMYDTVTQLNPKANTFVLSDKKVFLEHYKQFVRHWHINLNDLERNKNILAETVPADVAKIVIKNAKGQCGRGIEIVDYKEMTADKLIGLLKESGNDIVEEFVQQHDDLNKLSPSGLNTLRVITTINDKGEVEILGVRLRITINSHIDNLAAGNIACEVDEKTGKIIGAGVFSDITKEEIFKHPVTGVGLIGFQVPFFQESIALAKSAALFDTSNRSIGWDVAITNKGPELIEGNHNWCKLLWQLPAKRGMRSVLEKFVP